MGEGDNLTKYFQNFLILITVPPWLWKYSIFSHKVPSGTSSTSVPYSSTASPTLPQPPPLPQRRPEHDGTTEKDFRMCNKTWRKSLRCLRFHDQNGKWFPRPHANSFFLLQHAPPCMQQTVECSRKEGSTTVGGGGTCPNAANASGGGVPNFPATDGSGGGFRKTSEGTRKGLPRFNGVNVNELRHMRFCLYVVAICDARALLRFFLAKESSYFSVWTLSEIAFLCGNVSRIQLAFSAHSLSEACVLA